VIPPNERAAFAALEQKARDDGRHICDVLDEAGVLITAARQKQIEMVAIRRLTRQLTGTNLTLFLDLAGVRQSDATLAHLLDGIELWVVRYVEAEAAAGIYRISR
jgi:hypothetical protein